MIQFNLLPDVKIKYIKARQQKKRLMLSALTVGAVSLGIFTLMVVYVYGIQGTQIANYDKKIKASQGSISNKNKQVDDINKVLTVQNQLKSLDILHADKPVVSRIFEYLGILTPSNITISKLQVDNTDAHTIGMQGSTDTLESINRFVDTLKFTTYKSSEEGTVDKQVFTGVVLNSFSRNKGGASYSLTFTFDPLIFQSTSTASQLNVPSKVTTRSELGRPILQSDIEQQNNAPDTTTELE